MTDPLDSGSLNLTFEERRELQEAKATRPGNWFAVKTLKTCTFHDSFNSARIAGLACTKLRMPFAIYQATTTDEMLQDYVEEKR